MAVERREPGGTLTLLGLIDQHRGAFDYDWRSRFHLAVDDIPERMPWDEAVRLTRHLAGDPSSAVASALAGWSGVWSREAHILADMYDLLHSVNSVRKPRPYPRPGDRQRSRIGGSRGNQRTVRAALAARGHLIRGG